MRKGNGRQSGARRNVGVKQENSKWLSTVKIPTKHRLNIDFGKSDVSPIFIELFRVISQFVCEKNYLRICRADD